MNGACGSRSSSSRRAASFPPTLAIEETTAVPCSVRCGGATQMRRIDCLYPPPLSNFRNWSIGGCGLKDYLKLDCLISVLSTFLSSDSSVNFTVKSVIFSVI